MWAKARNLREVREINTDEIKLWLNSLRKEPEPEKQGRRKQAARLDQGAKAPQGVKHRELRHDHPRILRLAGGGEQAAGGLRPALRTTKIGNLDLKLPDPFRTRSERQGQAI